MFLMPGLVIHLFSTLVTEFSCICSHKLVDRHCRSVEVLILIPGLIAFVESTSGVHFTGWSPVSSTYSGN